MAVVLYGEGAINMHISLFPGADGGYNMTVTFPEGLASGQRGGQPRPQAQPGPRGAQAENWRRRDPAVVPGPKTQPRRRKANVAASAPGQQEGGNAKTRRNAKRTTAHREREAAAPTTTPRTGGFCPPAKAMRRMRTPEYSALPEGRRAGWRERDAEWDAEEARRVAEEAEVEEERSPMVEMAPAKAQEVGAPEEIAPEAAGELGAGAHAPQEAGTPEETAPEATGELGAGAHAPLAASPAIPSCSRLVKAATPETKEAAVPTTPPRAFLATACPPSLGKRGPSRSPSSASPGSSGGRLSPPIDADGFQLVVGRMGKGRSGVKVPKKARERERGGSS